MTNAEDGTRRDPADSSIRAAATARRRGHWWLAAVVFAVSTTAIFTGAVEWEHYRRLVSHSSAKPAVWDRVLLLWMLWWKSLILVAPLLMISGLLVWRCRLRTAWVLLMTGWVGILAWLAIDLRVQRVAGTHALDFLPNLYDAVMMPFEANHTEWGGDASAIVWGSILIVAVIAACGILAWRIARRVTDRWLCHRWPLCRPSGWIWTAGMACLPILVFPLVQGTANNRLLLRHAKSLLPVDVATIDSRLAGLTKWLGSDPNAHDWERGVRIISLLANPVGDDPGKEQVHLHNYTREDVNLDGWILEDDHGNRHRLDGPLPASATRVIQLPPKVLPLNNDGDTVLLLDSNSKEVHRVSYGFREAKYGSLVSFREPGDYDAFEFRLNTQSRVIFENAFAKLKHPWDIDRAAKIENRELPNVIYIVLESFRHSAVSPEVMSRLYEWGGQGIRCERHYAGSNSSHFGLFTLLYSRSPMTYHPCLDAKLPPQTTHTLRASGYENYFITSGDCRGFRRMDEYLSEDHFDEITIENGEDWKDWPARDRRTLAHVQRLAAGAEQQPRFIMAFLMSTHFPYSFPDEYNVHRPSGDDVSRANWSKTDPEVLHNRYKNSAQYLESEILSLIKSLDPRKNIIVITGDHGESMFEDGALAHASRGSEIQTRVPLLMVGPGIPSMVIDQPTTHTDVLPTLLHALAGETVNISHAHGRDLLSREPLVDQVMISPYRWKDPFDLVLKRGPLRLQFKYRLDRPEIQVFGFCDDSANLDLNNSSDASPRAASEWSEALREELGRMIR